MSFVMCHMSCVTCHTKNWKISKASKWRVCYEQGITHLVFLKKCVFNLYLGCWILYTIMWDLGSHPEEEKNGFCLDIDNFGMTLSPLYFGATARNYQAQKWLNKFGLISTYPPQKFPQISMALNFLDSSKTTPPLDNV